MSYLEYLSRLGEFKSIDVFKQAKGEILGFLHHINKGKYQKNILKLRVKKKQIRTLTSEEVKQIIDACHTKRDKLILMLMYEVV